MQAGLSKTFPLTSLCFQEDDRSRVQMNYDFQLVGSDSDKHL